MGTRHLVGPIRGVESAGRDEFVAGVRRRCGFLETFWPFTEVVRKIRREVTRKDAEMR